MNQCFKQDLLDPPVQGRIVGKLKLHTLLIGLPRVVQPKYISEIYFVETA